jgi:hypothetical protein
VDGSTFVSPANPYNSAAVLALDNSKCGSGGAPSSLSLLLGGYTNPNGWFVTLTESLGGWGNAFNGGSFVQSTYNAFNFDGSVAPFSGTAQSFSGTNVASGGCPAPGYLTPFQAWQFPSLGTTAITLNVVSQPGILNLPVTVNMNLVENDVDFSITASGTLTGPSCGPLTFASTDGQAIGNLYAFDANYTNPAGGHGTLSIGLSLITPYVVSQTQLQNAGYIATGPGLALQVWSIDWSASSDGSCAADPIVLGFGVAYPRHGKAEPRRKDKDKKFDWKKFRDRWEHARVAEDRDSAFGGKQ